MNFSDPQHVLTVLRLLISIDYISLSPHDPVSHLGDDDNGVQAADVYEHILDDRRVPRAARWRFVTVLRKLAGY